MKKTLSFLALAALVAGCSSDNPAANSKSPWASDGSAGSTGHPMVLALGGTPGAAGYTPVDHGTYSWEKNKKPVVVEKAAAPVAPEEGNIVITDVRGDLGLISFIAADAPVVNQTYIVIKHKKPVRIRVTKVSGENAIAEIPPNQVDIPSLTIGEKVEIVADPSTPL